MATKKQSGAAVGTELALVAALAAAGAGAYWLYGAKDASKNRKAAKGWMLKARGEVLQGVEKLKDIDKEKYQQIVDSVLKRYKTMNGITAAEVAQMASDFKDSWQHMQKAAKPAKKAVTKEIKKVVAKAKKAVKSKK